MRKLLFQSDDYGLTDSVADGILKGIDQGIIRNTGLFVNMPSSARAAEKIRDRQGICVGIDIKLVAGQPVSDPAEVPSLVSPEWHVVPSVQRIREGRIIGRQGMCLCFEEDPYDSEQTLLETENQVKRFKMCIRDRRRDALIIDRPVYFRKKAWLHLLLVLL